MSLVSAGLTHIGMVRKSNQDAIYLNPRKHLYIVADGMGGHNGGDIASAMAVKYIPEYLLSHIHQADPIVVVKSSLQYANKAIREKSMSSELLKGMGTTAVMIYFHQGLAYIANVGDSRAYLIQKNNVYQLTRDHSLVQEKLNIGLYNREQAMGDEMKNILVRTVGYEDVVEVDVFTYRVTKNDLFILCSDGLHGKVCDADLVHMANSILPDVSKSTYSDINYLANKLVDLANSNGGQDNISIIAIAAI